MSKIFICYRHSDVPEAVDRIHEHLSRRFSGELFKDVNSITPATDFRRRVALAFNDCKLLLVIIGPHWLSATTPDGRRRLVDPEDPVRVEIETALNKGIKILPLLVGNTQMPAADVLPPSLNQLSYIVSLPIRRDPDFAADIKRLQRFIRTELRTLSLTKIIFFAGVACAAVAGATWIWLWSPENRPPQLCNEIADWDHSKAPPVVTKRSICN